MVRKGSTARVRQRACREYQGKSTPDTPSSTDLNGTWATLGQHQVSSGNADQLVQTVVVPAGHRVDDVGVGLDVECLYISVTDRDVDLPTVDEQLAAILRSRSSS
jgi:hypothetical protein